MVERDSLAGGAAMKDRDMQRVLARIEPEPMSGCWVWIGARTGAGYGHIDIARRRMYAHRLVYEEWCGPIPDGMELDHRCRLTCCVNPRHLEAVPHRVNIKRGHFPNKRKVAC